MNSLPNNGSETQSNTKPIKGNKALFALLLVFILPVAAAKLVLSMDLYQGGATNQGELISPQVNYATLSMDNPLPKRWQVIYLLPAQCEQSCQDRLYLLHQSHIALGKDQDRVSTVILTQASSDLTAVKAAATQTASYTLAPANDQLANLLNSQQIIIVDPLGNLVMRYNAVEAKEGQLTQGKAILADLRKMLKLSRVG